MLKYHIQTIEVGSGGTAAVMFSNIPQTYDDLLLLISAKGTTGTTSGYAMLDFNETTSPTVQRHLLGNGSSAASYNYTNQAFVQIGRHTETSNTFGIASVYIPNYTSTTSNKVASIDGVTENNAAGANQFLNAHIWSNTAPITSIRFVNADGDLTRTGTFLANSSFTLYGIKRGSDGKTLPVAYGGTVTTSGGYTIHTFNSSGTFVANRNLNVEYVVVGGGAGSTELGGGGGAGGYRSSVAGESSGGGASAEASMSVSAGTAYLVTVGAGGSGRNNLYTAGDNGSSSTFSSITSLGGGGGARYDQAGVSGASGGGAGRRTSPGGAGTSGQGYAGGNGTNYTSDGSGGGGGGAGQVGQSNPSGPSNGGAGVTSSISGSAVTRAGGGGGGSGLGGTGGTGGSGGGGNGGGGAGQTGSNGTANTGGGAGGGSAAGGNGGSGGSGVVIIRYPTPA